jgi:anti-sigma regulatory factor (Ser/Thr protein kinase)
MPTEDTALREPRSRTWSRDFAPYERCVPRARREVEEVLAVWGRSEDEIAAAALVTGELAANAVRHAHVPGRTFSVTVTVSDGGCTVEVTDPVVAPPCVARPGPAEERGRGLLLVEAVSAGYGYRSAPGGGKTVWAALPAPVRPACGERAYLPERLVPAALSAGPGAEPVDVERELRCPLEAHTTGDHHAFVRELSGPDTGAVWTRWTRGHLPSAVLVLPDCPAVRTHDSSYEPCAEFAGHPGAHSWQLNGARVTSPQAAFMHSGGAEPARRTT